MIADYIVNVKQGVLTASVDNNWKITGVSWDEELYQQEVALVCEGKLTIPTSADGRTPNARSVTEADLQ